MRTTGLHHRLSRGIRGAAPALAATLLLTVPLQLGAQERAAEDPVPPPFMKAAANLEQPITYSEDVAAILQENCQVCHREGSIAPMSLTNYEEVRPWAPLIRERVADREMPPWHMAPDVGIQDFRNDMSLTDEEIATIVTWVDAGAPEGDPANLPDPPEFPEGDQWPFVDELGEPDLVLESEPFTVPAGGQDLWWRPTIPTELEEERWVRAIAVKPSYPQGRQVVHHTLAFLQQEESIGGLLTEWAIGKTGELYPEGTGKLLQPGSRVGFEVHYRPSGEEVVADRVELGIWLYPEGETPEHPTQLQIFYVAGGSDLEIAPHSIAVHENTHRLDRPARLESYQPHMHTRGKAMMMEAIYPDGETELLSYVDNFNWNWHTNYIYDLDAAPLLPEGTLLKFTSWHDNTTDNPVNPDPDQYVTWGDRTVDEMAHAWVGVTYLDQEDFERLVAERESAEDASDVAQAQGD